MLNLLPYSSYTSTTHGILWPMSLGVLGDLGVPLTITTAHVLSGLCYVWMAFVGWFIISRQMGWLRSALLILPTALFVFSNPGQGDFLSLGTELFPICILLVALLFVCIPSVPPSMGRLLAASSICGLAIWAKPQVLLLALAIPVCGLGLRVLFSERGGGWLRDLFHELVAVALFFVLPTVCFLLLFAVTGKLLVFFREFQYTLWYLTSPQARAKVPYRVRTLYAGQMIEMYGIPAFIWAFAGLVGWTSLRSRLGRWPGCIAAAVWFVPVGAALLTLTSQYPTFPHYLNLLYAGCLMAGALGSSIWRASAPKVPRPPLVPTEPWVLAFGAALLLSGALWFAQVSVGHPIWKSSHTSHVEVVDRQKTLAMCPAGSRVVVWGWSPGLYSDFGWVPGSRYVDNVWQLSPTSQQAYYRQTMEQELRSSPPTCIIEAIGLNFFASFPTRDTIGRVLPGADRLLKTCYERRTAMVPGELPGDYVATVYRLKHACAGDQ